MTLVDVEMHSRILGTQGKTLGVQLVNMQIMEVSFFSQNKVMREECAFTRQF